MEVSESSPSQQRVVFVSREMGLYQNETPFSAQTTASHLSQHGRDARHLSLGAPSFQHTVQSQSQFGHQSFVSATGIIAHPQNGVGLSIAEASVSPESDGLKRSNSAPELWKLQGQIPFLQQPNLHPPQSQGYQFLGNPQTGQQPYPQQQHPHHQQQNNNYHGSWQ
eukprot:scaffold20776_cov42-Prasinocladus_malaysianus.AAC.1